MSEYSALNLIFKTERDKHPDWFTITDESIRQVEQRQKELRAVRHKAHVDSHPPVPLRPEYNRLRKELFDLQQHAKHTEIYSNEQAGRVEVIESRITDLLKQKKAAVGAGHLGQERFCEHNIQLLETELIDVRVEFNRARNQSTFAARGLKAFDGYARIAELQKELDTPKVIGKETA